MSWLYGFLLRVSNGHPVACFALGCATTAIWFCGMQVFFLWLGGLR